MSCSQIPPPESSCRGPSFAPRRSRRPPLAPGRPRRRCCRPTRLPRCPHPSRSQRAPRAAQAQGPRRYYSPPRSPPSAQGAARQGSAGSGAFTLREVTAAGTGGPPPRPRKPRPTQLHPCAHFADANTKSPTRQGFLVHRKGSCGKTGPRSLASQSRALSHPRQGGQWPVRPFPPPFRDSRRVVRSMGPVRAQWFSPSAPRVPPGAGSVVQPTGPLGQWLAPPSPGSHAEGADSDGPGAWRLGAVPGAACAPGPTPSCGGAGFRSGKCESD